MTQLFIRNNQKIFFQHIPKTGGQSVKYLLEKEDWKECEKQHIDIDKFRKTIKGDNDHLHNELIAHWKKDWEWKFTIVRNPYDRYCSQIKHVANAINIKFEEINAVGILIWSNDLFTRLLPKLGVAMDNNHFRPQTEFLGPDMDIFKLEDTASLITELKSRNYISKNAVMPHINKNPKINISSIRDILMQDQKLHKAFLDLYRKDFESFNYKI